MCCVLSVVFYVLTAVFCLWQVWTIRHRGRFGCGQFQVHCRPEAVGRYDVFTLTEFCCIYFSVLANKLEV